MIFPDFLTESAQEFVRRFSMYLSFLPGNGHSFRRSFLAAAVAFGTALFLAAAPIPGGTSLSARAAESIYPSTSATKLISNQVAESTFAILINAKTGKVVAQKNGDAYMYPASMTKVMTLLVASEYVKNLTDTVTITQDILDYCAEHDCSTVGFAAGERVTVMDLLWGTILPSGADAAMALGRYVAGTDDAFVQLMNAKAAELGLQNTHFTNCIGLFDMGHYTTCNDMAVIMNAAVSNQTALTILVTPQYITVPTSVHSSGITVKNLFLSRIAPLDKPGIVLGAKTGYVNQSRYCAVSYFLSSHGVPYICVTGMASSSMNAVYDHQRIYSAFAK